MLEALAEVFVQATQPRSAHTAIHAVKRSGLGWIDKLAARLRHRHSLRVQALLENQIGRSFQPDLSEGWVSTRARRAQLPRARRAQLPKNCDVV